MSFWHNSPRYIPEDQEVSKLHPILENHRKVQMWAYFYLTLSDGFVCWLPWQKIFSIGLTLYLVKVKVAQSCPALCNPIDYTVLGILQAGVLEWVAFPFFRESSQPRDQTQVSHVAGRFLYQLSHQGSPRILEWVAYPFSSGSSWIRNWTMVSCIVGGFLPTELSGKPLYLVCIITRMHSVLSHTCLKPELLIQRAI